MKIRTHMGVSADGYVASVDGRPTVLLLGEGLPLSSPATPLTWLELESQRTFDDGSVELAYSLSAGERPG